MLGVHVIVVSSLHKLPLLGDLTSVKSVANFKPQPDFDLFYLKEKNATTIFSHLVILVPGTYRLHLDLSVKM